MHRTKKISQQKEEEFLNPQTKGQFEHMLESKRESERREKAAKKIPLTEQRRIQMTKGVRRKSREYGRKK